MRKQTKNFQFGLTDEVRKFYSRIFEGIPELDEVVIFGSRAKGNYSDGSDIDLAFKGKNITLETILSAMCEIEKYELLYKTDILNYRLGDEKIKDHIDRVGKCFWKKPAIGTRTSSIE